MSKELYIQVKGNGVEIALLENKNLIEYHTEPEDSQFQVGDFYLGKVKKIIPAMNAAFVDVGFEKDGFLHYTDLSPHIDTILNFTKQLVKEDAVVASLEKFTPEPDTLKKGKIEDVLKAKPYVLVQILKQPIASKGPRLTCEFSLSGRHVVVTPFGSGVNLSKKIHGADERKRLLQHLNALKTNNFGIIARTAADGKSFEELQQDVNNMMAVWQGIEANIKGSPQAKRVRSEDSKINTLLRDLLNADFTSVVTNDKSIEQNVKEYLQKNAPEKVSITKCLDKSYNIFDTYNITKQIKSLFGRTVHLSSGAYLIIEKTEALHVVDVNSGTRASSINQESNALETNLEAVTEIVRQLRLRDLGGIIVVDFIDMKLPDNKKKVMDSMYALMKSDRAKHSILPLSKFNLMQITRQRMKPEVNLDVQDICPSCKGNGKIAPMTNIQEDITKSLDYITPNTKFKLTLLVHPIIKDYVQKGFFSKQMKWMLRYRKRILIKGDKNIAFNNYAILDEQGEEIMQK